MTCHEFESLLDRLEPGASLPAQARAHAASCPACAFALRLEAELREAPRWAQLSRLSTERRAGVLARARVMAEGMGVSGAGPLLEQSALTATVSFVLLVVLGYGVPPILKGALPPALYASVAEQVSPALQSVRALLDPLLQQGWGLALLAAAGFSLCFAAAVSARLFAEAQRA